MVVDGIAYTVNWKRFVIGASFFVPCIHAYQAKEDVKQISKRLGYKIVSKVVIEDGIRGLRVWRVK